MDPRELGELGLIEVLRRRAGAPGRRWRIGIGDDAALLASRAGTDLVWTADALVEDVHFRWSTADPRALGRKALRVNLSDLSAMGARPLGFLLTLAIPGDAPGARVDGFARGLLAEARDAGCPLVGGDTSRAARWCISISALGELPRGRALRRDAARPGDALLVVGELGGSALGLHVLEHGGPRDASERRFVRMHRLPRVPLGAGPLLARRGWARTAIDVSDGLARDLGHVLASSGVGAEVELGALPLPRGLARACAQRGLEPWPLALSGGEDYALLVAAPPDAPGDVRLARALDTRVTRIGRVVAGRGCRWLRDGTVEQPSGIEGFEHFKPL